MNTDISFKEIQKILKDKVKEHDYYERIYDDLNKEVDELEKLLFNVAEAHQIITQVSQEIQQSIHKKITGIVNQCLAYVFEDPYTFEMRFVTKRNQTEVELVFLRNGVEIDPMTASGGGVVDVTSFALWLACLLLKTPKLRKILILDEPFKFVSAEYRPKIRIMLEALAEELDVQFIMISHIKELMLGNVIEI